MILLPIHIIAGLTGIVSGFVALYTLKGAKLHRKSGKVFVYTMLVVAITGTVMGALLSEMAAVIPGVLAFYLVITALRTVRGPVPKFHWTDLGALLLALILGISSIVYGFVAEGQPTALYVIFGAVALLAALGDVRMILAGGIQGAHRIARHLWRMCLALFIATGSFFLGQADEFPEQLRNFALLPFPVLLVLLTMVYWLVRVLFTQWHQRNQQQVSIKVSASFRKAPDAGRSTAK
ncbi:MAG TPA: hypothetical protein VJ821_08775 [Anaerolineales bacterium]|nr:hypothetical protein [Anaerolineales bacterium]